MAGPLNAGHALPRQAVLTVLCGATGLNHREWRPTPRFFTGGPRQSAFRPCPSVKSESGEDGRNLASPLALRMSTRQRPTLLHRIAWETSVFGLPVDAFGYHHEVIYTQFSGHSCVVASAWFV